MPVNARNPFVFVVGCPRSGTTLLQRMLDHHPRLTVANDSHFIVRAIKKRLKTDPDPVMSEAIIDEVIGYHRFHRMGLDRNEVEAAASGAPTYSSFVARLYDRRGVLHGKPLSGEKTPDYCRYIPQLAALVPEARFVHIVRDGRNTALSTLKWAKPDKGPGRWAWWEKDALACCALWWTWQTWQGIRDGRALPPARYHQLLYEDLVAQPVQQLQKISEFLDLEYSDEMVNFHRGKTVENPALSAKSAWKPATKGLRDWRGQMAAEDQAVFQALAGDLLDLLSYPATQQGSNPAVESRVEQAYSFWDGARQSRDIADLMSGS